MKSDDEILQIIKNDKHDITDEELNKIFFSSSEKAKKSIENLPSVQKNAEAKESSKRRSKQGIERHEKNRAAKLLYNQPVTTKEIQKIVQPALQIDKKVKQHFTDKKIMILGLNNSKFIRSDLKKCKHILKATYFESSNIVTTCKKCSTIKTMTSHEWRLYLTRNKKVI